MIISQGRYTDIAEFYGSVDAAAVRYAAADVVAFSHADDWGANGCIDTGDPILPELIAKIREINPSVEIFGYVSGTADAPSGCGYGPGHEYAQTGWMPANGICSKFIEWSAQWDSFGVDGYLIDLTAPQYMSAAVRDSVYSWCRYKGKRIMANSTYPSAHNVMFAAAGLQGGDYLLIEAFCYGLGDSTLAGTNAALAQANALRGAGFSVAALCTESWSSAVGVEVDPSSVKNQNAKSLMINFGSAGDAYQYDNADLGIVCRTIPAPAI